MVANVNVASPNNTSLPVRPATPPLGQPRTQFEQTVDRPTPLEVATGMPLAAMGGANANAKGGDLVADNRVPTPMPGPRPRPMDPAPGTLQSNVPNLPIGRTGSNQTNPNAGQAGFSQGDSRWGNQDYTAYPRWEVGGRVIAGGATGKFSEIGCTLTALTNGLRIVNPNSGVTPGDTNALNRTFKSAFDDTRFTDLSGQNRSLSAQPFHVRGPDIQQLRPPVSVNGADGQQITARIRDSLQHGQPVLVGFRDASGSATRHSATAVGYSNGQVQLLDSYTGKVMPMKDFLKTYGYPNAQFDYAYSMRHHTDGGPFAYPAP
jgi:hypothetical protein